MTNEHYVGYVKSHIQSDIDVNRAISGRDYSLELGVALSQYLNRTLTPQQRLMIGVMGLGELEQKLAAECGKMVNFHETKKCALPISEIINLGDEKSYNELFAFAQKLIGREEETGGE